MFNNKNFTQLSQVLSRIILSWICLSSICISLSANASTILTLLTPKSLENLQINYHIEQVQNNGLPPQQNYPEKGTSIVKYNQTHLVADNFDAYFFDYSSPYQYQVTSNTSAQIQFFDGLYVRQLQFDNDNSGDFQLIIAGGAAIVSGSFTTSYNYNTGLAPLTLTNQGFNFKVDTISGDSHRLAELPPFEQQLKFLFGHHTQTFIQSDQYDLWQYNGDYFYQRSNDNTATFNTYLRQTGLGIAMQLNFTYIKGGQGGGSWQATVGSDITLSGTFARSNINRPSNHQFKGTIVDKQVIRSEITGIDYGYRIYLPQQYKSNQKYPIIYATDGQWVFWDFAKAIDLRELDVILVAIEEGPENRRFYDYALPGSNDYLDFFEQQLIPTIEAQYKIDRKNRTIQGASLGGLLVTQSLYRNATLPKEQRIFSNYIATDPSYFYLPDEYAELEKLSLGMIKQFKANLYLHGATAGGNGYFTTQIATRLEQRQINRFNITNEDLHVRHIESPLPAFVAALEAIFD